MSSHQLNRMKLKCPISITNSSSLFWINNDSYKSSPRKCWYNVYLDRDKCPAKVTPKINGNWAVYRKFLQISLQSEIQLDLKPSSAHYQKEIKRELSIPWFIHTRSEVPPLGLIPSRRYPLFRIGWEVAPLRFGSAPSYCHLMWSLPSLSIIVP